MGKLNGVYATQDQDSFYARAALINVLLNILLPANHWPQKLAACFRMHPQKDFYTVPLVCQSAAWKTAAEGGQKKKGNEQTNSEGPELSGNWLHRHPCQWHAGGEGCEPAYPWLLRHLAPA